MPSYRVHVRLTSEFSFSVDAESEEQAKLDVETMPVSELLPYTAGQFEVEIGEIELDKEPALVLETSN